MQSVKESALDAVGISLLIFPPAPDGTKTYDSATGVLTQHASSNEAFDVGIPVQDSFDNGDSSNCNNSNKNDFVSRPITFTERAAMRTQCRKLTKYIRLADFFVIDTFLALASTSTEGFLSHIKSRSNPH